MIEIRQIPLQSRLHALVESKTESNLILLMINRILKDSDKKNSDLFYTVVVPKRPLSMVSTIITPNTISINEDISS